MLSTLISSLAESSFQAPSKPLRPSIEDWSVSDFHYRDAVYQVLRGTTMSYDIRTSPIIGVQVRVLDRRTIEGVGFQSLIPGDPSLEAGPVPDPDLNLMVELAVPTVIFETENSLYPVALSSVSQLALAPLSEEGGIIWKPSVTSIWVGVINQLQRNVEQILAQGRGRALAR